MMRQVYLIIILGVLAVVTATAQTVTVEYLEGLVEVETKTDWEMVMFGDTLVLTDKVKVAKDSLLELAYGDIKISVTRAGQYTVQDLVNSRKQVNSWQLGTLIDWKIQQLAGTAERRMQSTTMGVRGDKLDTKDIEWMYMDEENGEADLLQQGEALLQSAQYAEAITLFEELVKKGVAREEEPYLHYYLAFANAANAQQIAALKEIDKIQITSEHPLHDGLLLLKGRLLIDTLAFKEALEMFNAYLSSHSGGETAQSVLILSSFCYKGLNNTSEQKKSLARAEKLAPDSPLGKEARRLLKGLKS